MTPDNLVPICDANLILCDSPPDSVPACLESVKYSNPTFIKKPNLTNISFMIGSAIFFRLPSNLRFLMNECAFVIDILVTSTIFFFSIVTAREYGFNLFPLQSGQILSVIYLS